MITPAPIQFIIFTLLMAFTSNVYADSLKSLLMPGPVIEAHAEYEQECDQCHDTSDKDKQGQLCMSCHEHENILDDLSNKTGFHGRLSAAEKTDCKHCHTEHVGRDAKIILLNASTFDHHKTDFPLKGQHVKVACDTCHKSDKKYHEAPANCYSCHKDDDVHKGKQGKKCEDCHSASNWKKTEFDHSKTDFELKGSHKKVSCSSCHLNKKYKDTPKTCFGCHQINDVHRSSYGKKCETCHVPSKWDKAKFDHKKTDFPLHGKHKKVTCISCHTPGNTKELPTKCYSCHKNDDSHKGRNGKKCSDCHTSSSWKKQKFNHDKKTDFPLLGKHKKLKCNQCHRGDLYNDELTTQCVDCHKKDDVHKGKQGEKCQNCHSETSWHDSFSFDHDLSQFPLIGMHAATQCEECHLTTAFSKTETDCNKCHAGDDVHKTRLGTDCGTCHNPNSWFTWIFDHEKDTSFKIDGAHDELGCYDCHKTGSDGKLEASEDCISCHRTDDIHNRQFGRQCNDCHSTDSFKDAVVGRQW
jgi:hypothetical protein